MKKVYSKREEEKERTADKVFSHARVLRTENTRQWCGIHFENKKKMCIFFHCAFSRFTCTCSQSVSVMRPLPKKLFICHKIMELNFVCSGCSAAQLKTHISLSCASRRLCGKQNGKIIFFLKKFTHRTHIRHQIRSAVAVPLCATFNSV